MSNRLLATGTTKRVIANCFHCDAVTYIVQFADLEVDRQTVHFCAIVAVTTLVLAYNDLFLGFILTSDDAVV